jgi:hypothetical protein
MYPNKAEILARPLRHRRTVVQFVRAWRRTYRGRRRTPEALTALLTGLAGVYRRPVRLVFDCSVHESAHYVPTTRTIHLPDCERGSIVTALHEFAHHLYGHSELTACRWSVWLFKRTFPRTYARCTFEGHMLRLTGGSR